MIDIKVFSASGEIPRYETESAAGLDLRAHIKEDLVLRPLERMLVPTGIFLEIPAGYEGQVRARSGLAIKYGISLINGIGTIDADYRGELKVPLVNLGNEDFLIKNGDRIAQIVFAKFQQGNLIAVEDLAELSHTKRGNGGFGHTGV